MTRPGDEPGTVRRTRRPQSGRALTAALALAAAVAAGCTGDPAADSVSAASTTPSVVADDGELAAATDELLSPADSGDGGGSGEGEDQGMEPLPVGPPLSPGASAEDILAALESVHGPTDDLAGQMNRFATFPTIETPPGAQLLELRADVRNADDGVSRIVTAETLFSADGSPEEIAEFLATELEALGLRPSMGLSTVESDDSVRRAYDDPSAPYPRDDVEFSIVADEPMATSPRCKIRFRSVTQVAIADDDIRERYEDWAAALPVPSGGEVTGAGVQTTSIGRRSAHYFLDVTFSGQSPEEVAAGLRSALPTGEISLERQPAGGGSQDAWIYLSSPYFADLRVSTHEPAAPADTTILNIDARADFAPISTS